MTLKVWLSKILPELFEVEDDKCPQCKGSGFCFGTYCNGSGKLPRKTLAPLNKEGNEA